MYPANVDNENFEAHGYHVQTSALEAEAEAEAITAFLLEAGINEKTPSEAFFDGVLRSFTAF